MTKRIMRHRSALLGVVLVGLFLGISLVGPFFLPADPFKQNLAKSLSPPGEEHLLGTDHLGRDIASRLIIAARTSLLIGAAAVILGGVVGTVAGTIAALAGRWTDTAIMRAVDVLLAFPGLLLAIAIASAIGPGVRNVIFSAAVFSVPAYARIMRGAVLRIKGLEYVTAARAAGGSEIRIAVKHLLRNCMAPLIVQSSLRFAEAIIVSSSLSFLGLGVQPDTPEWGALLSEGRTYLRSAPWVATFPGMALIVAVLGFNLLGDGLRDILDPRLRHTS